MAGKGAPRRFPKRFEELMEASGRDAVVSRPIVSLVRAGGRVTRVMDDALASAGLTGPQFNVLMELASSSGESLPIYELMDRLLRSAPNTSALISRMEKDGLLTKTRDPNDARVVTATITREGWARLRKGAPLVFAAERALLRGLNREDLVRLAGSLEEICTGEAKG